MAPPDQSTAPSDQKTAPAQPPLTATLARSFATFLALARGESLRVALPVRRICVCSIAVPAQRVLTLRGWEIGVHGKCAQTY